MAVGKKSVSISLVHMFLIFHIVIGGEFTGFSAIIYHCYHYVLEKNSCLPVKGQCLEIRVRKNKIYTKTSISEDGGLMAILLVYSCRGLL